MSCLSQMIASIDGEAFTAIEPRVIENAEESLVGSIGLEVGSRFIDQSDLVHFIGRTGGIVIGDAPLGNPTWFPLRTALLSAFGQNVLLQSPPAFSRGGRVSRIVRPRVGVNAVNVH